jgi:hypothetical protein
VLRDKEAAAQKAAIESRERELSEAKRAAAAAATGSSHASQAAAAQAAVYVAEAERDAALFESKAARAVANEQSHERARMP